MRLVQVEYLDHTVGQLNGVEVGQWISREDAAKLQPAHVWQVGWIVHDADDVLVLAPAVLADEETVGRPDVIVRSCVISIIDLA